MLNTRSLRIHSFGTETDAINWLKSQYFDTSKRLGSQYSRTCPHAVVKIRNHHMCEIMLDNYGRVITKRVVTGR